jgi:hypothetical protein
MTGLRAGAVPAGTSLSAAGRAIGGGRTFGDRRQGEALWYENANGLIEIAVNRGRADRILRLAIGTPVAIGSGTKPAAKPPKPRKQGGKPVAGNPRLADQTRKILGKHYANKYRVK